MKHIQFRVRNGQGNFQKLKQKSIKNDSQVSSNQDDFGHGTFQNHSGPPINHSLNHDFINIFQNILGTLQQLKNHTVVTKRPDLQVRDRSYLLEIPHGHTYQKSKQILKKWIQKMVSDVVSIGFNYYSNDQLTYEQTKIFCSENILSNISALVNKYKLSSAQLKEVDQFIRDEVLQLLLKKYPMTDSIVANRALQAIAKTPDLSDKIENDFFSFNQIQFSAKSDYSKEIKLTINSIINRTNELNKLVSSSSNFQAFKRCMGKIFEMVEDNEWMLSNQAERNLAFESTINQMQNNSSSSLVKTKESIINIENDNQKREYRQKVKQYTSYLIGRKVSQNMAPFSQEEVEAKGIEIKSTAILRILTKWCEELWQKFIPRNYYANKSEDFRLITGQIKVLSPQMKSHLDKIMQSEKAQIRLFMAKLTNDNYETQINLLNQLLTIQNSEDEFWEQNLEKVSGKFSVLIGKSLQKWVVKYLNRLLQGLSKVSKQFYQKYMQKDWPCPPNLITFKIGDLLRCKCASAERQILYVFKQIKWLSDNRPDLLSITRIKNRLNLGTNDILMNVKFCGSIISEIQLAVNSNKSKFLKSSHGMSHYLYEVQRSLFGPINQLGSIWRNLDLRASYFDKSSSFGKNSGVHRCQADKKTFQLDIFDGSFICSLCKLSYSQNKMLIKHVKCSQCSFWKCTHCLAKQITFEQLAISFSLNAQVGKQLVKKVEIDQQNKELPNYGIAIPLKGNNGMAQVIFFQKLQVRGVTYLFERRDGNMKLVLKMAEEGVQMRFLRDHLVFEVNEQYGNTQLNFSVDQVKREYFLPLQITESYQNSKNSITIQNQPLTEENCRNIFKGSKQQQQIITTLTLVNTYLKKISPLEQIFQNIEEITLDRNISLQNYKGLQSFKKLKTFTLKGCVHLQTIPSQIFYATSIVELTIKNCQFQIIPPQVELLKQLRKLNLSQNEDKNWRKAINQIPIQLFSLVNLEQLDLSYQYIRQLPGEIGQLKNLKYLNIRSNAIPKLPQTINDLILLEFFDFRENTIKQLPKSLSGLRKLKDFRLEMIGEDILQLFGQKMHKNSFSELPQDLQNIQQLKVIDIHSQNLNHLPSLEACQNLEEVNLFRCSLIALPRLKKCSSLKKLNLKQQMNKNPNQFFTSISPEFFKQTPNLQYFCASFNYLKALPTSIMQLTQLVELDLSHNQIGEICQQIRGCISLVKADFSKNKISRLPSSLRNLQKLQFISLYQNELTTINQSLCQCISLQELYLSNNHIDSIPESISKLVNLQALNVESNAIQVLPSSLDNLKKIKQNKFLIQYNPLFMIQCSELVDRSGDFRTKNAMSYLKNGQFKIRSLASPLEKISGKIGKATNLTTIKISSQSLKQLPFEFSNLSNLVQINLNQNMFEIFPLPLTDCLNLKILEIDHNFIQVFPQQIGKLTNLQRLDLASNQLSEIDIAINKCLNLKYLILNSNHLTNLPNVSQLNNLQVIQLSFNQFTKFPEGLPQCKNLQQIQISFNKIKKLDCKFYPGVCLTIITLDHNLLTQFPEELLDCDSLQILKLSENSIVNISQNLHRLSNLRKLWMFSNKIQEIPRTIGLAKSLQQLYLPKNNISVIVKQLSQLTNVGQATFNIYNNPITHVQCREWIEKHGTSQTKKIAAAAIAEEEAARVLH